MRVTKLVREYIEKKVNEAYPLLPKYDKATVEEFEKKYNEIRNKTKENFINQIKELSQNYPTVVPACYNYLSDKQTAEKCWDDILKEPRMYLNNEHFITKDCLELSKKNEEINKKRTAAKEDILVSLELGANKKDLEDMLKNLREDNSI